MKNIAFKMYLNDGQKEVYKKRHDEIWPELENLLKKAGVSEYFICLDDETNTLFAFQKVLDSESLKDLADSSIMKKWWDFMADIMRVNADNSPVVVPLDEVFMLK